MPNPSDSQQDGSIIPDNRGSDEESGLQLAMMAAQAAYDRKASDIVILKVSKVSYLADYFVLMTGFSDVQVRAVSRAIEAKVEDELHRYPQRLEGMADASWVLQDYGDVIVHIFLPQEREFYNLEAFWGHGEQVPLALT